MPIETKVSGVWKRVTDIDVKVGGAWKDVSNVHTRVSGVWKEVFANPFEFNETISANTANYDLRAAAVTAGWNQSDPVVANVTVNSGVRCYATTTGVRGFSVPATFPALSTIEINHAGDTIGKGGNGGNGQPAGFAGSAGGTAMYLRFPVTLNNTGKIEGGGGGGGGGTAGDNAGCWVAQEIYGMDSPKWRLFKDWLLTDAPSKIRVPYLKYGEDFAKYISDKPEFKEMIKIWMDNKIAFIEEME